MTTTSLLVLLLARKEVSREEGDGFLESAAKVVLVWHDTSRPGPRSWRS